MQIIMIIINQFGHCVVCVCVYVSLRFPTDVTDSLSKSFSDWVVSLIKWQREKKGRKSQDVKLLENKTIIRHIQFITHTHTQERNKLVTFIFFLFCFFGWQVQEMSLIFFVFSAHKCMKINNDTLVSLSLYKLCNHHH